MGTIATQITSLAIVFLTVYLDTDQRKHQSSASLAFVLGIHRGPLISPHKWPVTRKMFPFDDVIMLPDCWNVIITTQQVSASLHAHPICTFAPNDKGCLIIDPLCVPLYKYCVWITWTRAVGVILLADTCFSAKIRTHVGVFTWIIQSFYCSYKISQVSNLRNNVKSSPLNLNRRLFINPVIGLISIVTVAILNSLIVFLFETSIKKPI